MAETERQNTRIAAALTHPVDQQSFRLEPGIIVNGSRRQEWGGIADCPGLNAASMSQAPLWSTCLCLT
jgi:hypothetical protein